MPYPHNSLQNNTTKQIPKIIHYCWFGYNKQPLAIKSCIASWKHHLADYEIMLWDETNFDVTSHPFTKAAYASGKFAFVSDYVRMQVLKEYGGIYLDTDVQILKSFDPFLSYDFFIGLENVNRFGTSTIGCQENHWLTKAMLAFYDSAVFNTLNHKAFVNVTIVSELLLDRGFSGQDEKLNVGRQLQLPIGTFGLASGITSRKNTKYAKHLYFASWKSQSNFRRSRDYISSGLVSDVTYLFQIAKYKYLDLRSRLIKNPKAL